MSTYVGDTAIVVCKHHHKVTYTMYRSCQSNNDLSSINLRTDLGNFMFDHHSALHAGSRRSVTWEVVDAFREATMPVVRIRRQSQT